MYIHLADRLIIPAADVVAIVTPPPDEGSRRRPLFGDRPVIAVDAPLSVRTYVVTAEAVYGLHLSPAAVRRRLADIAKGIPVSFYTKAQNNV